MSRVVGVPAEIKNNEYRVAITPDGVAELAHRGVTVLIEAGAGAGAEIGDEEYLAAGAELVQDAATVWQRADIVCKVKEPQPSEYTHFRRGLVLFTYLHLAAYPGVADALLEHGVTGVAYETVQTAAGGLPLLAPMSEVAGRMGKPAGSLTRPLANLVELGYVRRETPFGESPRSSKSGLRFKTRSSTSQRSRGASRIGRR